MIIFMEYFFFHAYANIENFKIVHNYNSANSSPKIYITNFSQLLEKGEGEFLTPSHSEIPVNKRPSTVFFFYGFLNGFFKYIIVISLLNSLDYPVCIPHHIWSIRKRQSNRAQLMRQIKVN